MRDEFMIRKVLAISSACFCLATLVLVICGRNHPVNLLSWSDRLGVYDIWYRNGYFGYGSHSGDGFGIYDPYRNDSWLWYRDFGNRPGFWSTEIHVPAWAVLFVLALYPTIWLASKRFVRHRRRKRNECIRCGYSLTGLPEPRCPECGNKS